MTRRITLAAVQYAPGLAADPLGAAEAWIRRAAESGARLILLPELFAGPYFCKTQEEPHFRTAHPLTAHPVLARLAPLAKALKVTLPLSLFEREGPHHYNTVVVIGPDGQQKGHYRKSHIPDGPGYQEKYYFRPGNTGFRTWAVEDASFGVGICWDQWFPEAARAMALQGAEFLLYPTAIGAEPQDPTLDTAMRWRRAMQGHAVANAMPVVAVNRIGDEEGQRFYGTSFICDQSGDIVAELGREEEGVISASFDLDALAEERAAWGFFRDRRPDLYHALCEA